MLYCCWYCCFKHNWVIRASMVSPRKKRQKKQSNRKFLSQLDNFDQDIMIGNTVSDRQENAKVNEGTGDQELTVGNLQINFPANENVVNVKTLERCLNENVDKEKGIIVDTVEDRIQNAVLTTRDSIITPKIELAIRSINASSGRDETSVMASSERGEHIGFACRSWKRLWKEQHISYVNYKWWDSKENSGWGKWIVGPRYTIWAVTTHSSHLHCFRSSCNGDVQ